MACFLVHGLVVSTWVSRIASVKSALHLGDGALGLALLGTAIGSVGAIPLCGAHGGAARQSRHRKRGPPPDSASLSAIPLAYDTPSLFAALLFYGAMAGANDVAMNAQAVATENCWARPPFHASMRCSASADCGRERGRVPRGAGRALGGSSGLVGYPFSRVRAGCDAAAGQHTCSRCGAPRPPSARCRRPSSR